MITLKKEQGKDFRILNLTDTQLAAHDWDKDHKNYRIITRTVYELVKRVEPDLITVTGDISWAGDDEAYDAFADYLDSFGRPWAPIWGNHDNQDGPDAVERVVERYLTHPLCVYERGDASLGNGNYIIAIEENKKIVEGLIMMDTHDKIPQLIPQQVVWYREQAAALKKLGCHDTTLMLHVPIYAYRDVWQAAAKDDVDYSSVRPENSADAALWNDVCRGAFGVCHENVYVYPHDDGAMAAIDEIGTTKHIVCGHAHVNNFVIPYKGIKFIYALKTGCGSYCDPVLNGGTVLAVNENGICDVWHEYVDISDLVK